MKIHKGDTVQMMIGKDAGKQAKILRVRPTDAKVLVEGLNIMKRHRKPRKKGEKGEMVSVPRFVPAANVMVVCLKCGKPTRVGYRISENIKSRICKKCTTEIN